MYDGSPYGMSTSWIKRLLLCMDQEYYSDEILT